MAPPGSLDARYEQLAGSEDERAELYVARRHLAFTIDEWQALPWWQRRVYVEGFNHEQEEQQRALDEAQADQGQGPASPVDAILGGSLDDVGGAGFKIG